MGTAQMHTVTCPTYAVAYASRTAMLLYMARAHPKNDLRPAQQARPVFDKAKDAYRGMPTCSRCRKQLCDFSSLHKQTNEHRCQNLYMSCQWWMDAPRHLGKRTRSHNLRRLRPRMLPKPRGPRNRPNCVATDSTPGQYPGKGTVLWQVCLLSLARTATLRHGSRPPLSRSSGRRNEDAKMAGDAANGAGEGRRSWALFLQAGAHAALPVLLQSAQRWEEAWQQGRGHVSLGDAHHQPMNFLA